jgi:hypothetical protein
MKLVQLNPETKLPEPTPELLLIGDFKDLMKRVKRVDGDADGRKKTMNLMEIGYIYFSCTYDSRFKLMDVEERERKIRELVGFSHDWQPDDLVKRCLNIYADTQVTESTELVINLTKSIQGLVKYLANAQKQLPSCTIEDAKTINEYLNTLDRIPKTVENLRQAKAQLDREHDALNRGMKGRTLNKYELDHK